VSYERKRNEANGEDNRDGSDDNRSWNCGHEGPSDDPAVNALRARQHRNFLATLLLSQGVPMLLGGDEIGRTQQGNNNAYCQDNELSWYDWQHVDEALLDFCARLVALRGEHPVLRRRRWFHGRAIHGAGCEDIAWFTLEGEQMEEENWGAGFVKTLGVFLNGQAIPNPNAKGEPVSDDSFYIVFNADDSAHAFTLPGERCGRRWTRLFDTAGGWDEAGEPLEAAATLEVRERSLAVLRRVL
jgi:glycogen operon protein